MRYLDLIDYQVREQPSREFLVEDRRSFSYGDVDAWSTQLANGLADLGCRPGSRVALLGQNSIEYIVVYLAAAKGGYVPVPLNFRLAAPEWEYIVEHSGATIILGDTRYVDQMTGLRERCPALEHVIVFDDTAASGATSIKDVVASASAHRPAVVVHGAQPMSQLYTSGTTGRPKGVITSHEAMAWQVAQQARILQPLGSLDGRFLAVAPLYHAGVTFLWMTAASWGGTVYVVEGFDPVSTASTLSEANIAWSMMVPAMFQACMMSAPQLAGSFDSLDILYYGGSTIPSSQLRSAMDYFGCRFLQCYGLTETLGMTALQPSDHDRGLAGAEHLLASAGRAFPGCDVGIIDAEGVLLPPNSQGEIVLRGPQTMTEYADNPSATAETIREDGWIRTGDAGYLDDEGYLYINDRYKDMIVTGGENVYPREIEEVLAAHPDVADVAVIGIPDEKWGESIVAHVVLRAGATATADDLIAACTEKLARFKRPRHVEFVDALPRNPMGKVLKFEMRKPYWVGKERSV